MYLTLVTDVRRGTEAEAPEFDKRAHENKTPRKHIRYVRSGIQGTLGYSGGRACCNVAFACPIVSKWQARSVQSTCVCARARECGCVFLCGGRHSFSRGLKKEPISRGAACANTRVSDVFVCVAISIITEGQNHAGRKVPLRGC